MSFRGQMFSKTTATGARLFVLALLVLWVWGGLIYANSRHGTFQFDDVGYIIKNKSLRDITNLSAIWHFRPQPTRVVAFYTFALNYHFHKFNVLGYHVVNVCIHAMNATLVWWLVYLLGRVAWTQRARSEVLWTAFGAAMVFLTHPMQTQAVSYLTQRFTSLATLFYLLSLCLYVSGRHLWRHSRGGARCCWGLAFLAGALGMFTKQIVITLPLMIGLIEMFRWTPSLERNVSRRWQAHWPWLMAVAAFLIVPAFYTFNVKQMLTMEVASDSHRGDYITPWRYILTQGRVITTYMRLWFFPLGQRLDYDFALSRHWWEIKALLSWLFLGGVGVWAFYGRRRVRLVAFGICWIFLTLSVESSVIVIRNVIFEHRTYLPSVGFVLVLVMGGRSLFKDKRKFGLSIVILIAVLSFLTIQRNEVWQHPYNLWRDAQLKSPHKARPNYNLGDLYYSQQRWDEAMTYLNKAISLDPDYYKSYADRGILYIIQGDVDLGLADFERVLTVNPHHGATLNNRGKVYSQHKRYDLALDDLNKALEIYPDYFTAYRNRGDVYMNIGQYANALRDYTHALNLNPSAHEVYFARGLVYERYKQFSKALRDYQRAVQLKSNYIKALNRRELIKKHLRNAPSNMQTP